MNILVNYLCGILGDHHACIHLGVHSFSCCLAWKKPVHSVINIVPVLVVLMFIFLAVCVKYKVIYVVYRISVYPVYCTIHINLVGVVFVV